MNESREGRGGARAGHFHGHRNGYGDSYMAWLSLEEIMSWLRRFSKISYFFFVFFSFLLDSCFI